MTNQTAKKLNDIIKKLTDLICKTSPSPFAERMVEAREILLNAGAALSRSASELRLIGKENEMLNRFAAKFMTATKE